MDHREIFAEMSELEWQQWRHHPITAAFLAFLRDQQMAWRELAADLVELGAFDPNNPHEDRNPHVVRGKLRLVAMLQQLSVKDIQEFYRGEREGESSEPGAGSGETAR